ncbi:N-acetylmuramoyl-L-alanine amidase [Lysobacter sp. CA199]|uniref:N-acetylmuramoyl-L-alanine amidase n=1 Tax=Lysobacter sp. CA199 TaxID=3455608 RepID=UPI003F8D869F
MPRKIDHIVIHCSATPNGSPLFRGLPGQPGYMAPVDVIDEMHRTRKPPFKRGMEWRRRVNSRLGAIGYHFIIYTTGAVATGRHLDEVGAHVAGHNERSIGVCLLGTSGYTQAQWDALATLIATLRRDYPAARICGHRDLSPDKNGDGRITSIDWLKTCPGFDVARWLSQGMTPDAANILNGGL